MDEEAEKTRANSPQRSKATSRQIVLSSFNDRFSGKLAPGYAKTATAIDDVRCLWLLDRRQQAFIRHLENDEKYDHVVSLLRAFSF